MLQEIGFQQYRIFSEEQRLNLAPITVLFGKNNVGKSAILKLPLLIKSMLEGMSNEVVSATLPDGIWLFNEAWDLVYGKANKAVGLRLLSDKEESLDFTFFVEQGEAGPVTMLEDWNLKREDGRMVHIQRTDEGKLCGEDGTEIEFRGICPQNDIGWKDLKAFGQDIYYLGAFRDVPAPEFRINPSKLGGSGGALPLYEVLVRDALEVQHPLLDKVSEWYEKNFEGWKVVVDKHRAPVFSITLDNGRVKSNLLDTGMGIIQSMPVVISACRMYERPTLVILEEPETHLHPAAHGELSELLARQAGKDKRFLIETHSKNFIMRLRCMIAEGTLHREDVALYYVEYDANKRQSLLRQVVIDDNGEVENWPEGVFEDALEEALRFRSAQKNRRRL